MLTEAIPLGNRWIFKKEADRLGLSRRFFTKLHHCTQEGAGIAQLLVHVIFIYKKYNIINHIICALLVATRIAAHNGMAEEGRNGTIGI